MKNIERLRYKAGLTQKQLAEKLGIHEATVSHLENGTWKPQRVNKTVFQLEELFQKPIDWLLADSTRPTLDGSEDSSK